MESVDRVMSAFAQVDQKIAAFQLKTGLRCVSGCGRCCPESDIQTTVLEMIPAAHEILCRGQSGFWIDRIAEQNSTGRCVFFSTEQLPDSSGHCEFYKWRPAICRLFGFATVHNRLNQKLLAACKYMKQTCPETVATAVACQDEAPCFSDVGTSIYGLDPALGTRLMPINEALEKAVTRLGLYMQMVQNESLGHITAA